MDMPMLDHLKANNRAWAERMVSVNPDFFKRLERQQAPEYLWIGCSDTRVPAGRPALWPLPAPSKYASSSYPPAMAKQRHEPGPPMTLGNMRAWYAPSDRVLSQ